MGDLAMAWGSALWLGVLTSVSPCPLATNVAAVSFVGKDIGAPAKVLLAGAAYTFGRSVAYAALASLLVAGLFAIPSVSFLLQLHLNKALGPILILVGILLLDLVPISFPAAGVSDRVGNRLRASGLLGAGLLGVLFALSFCPVSAALFFGSLLPLAARHGSAILLPSAYGVGTGLPVLAFAVLIATGAQSVGRAFERVVRWQRWARLATAAIFILVGIRFCLTYILGVQL